MKSKTQVKPGDLVRMKTKRGNKALEVRVEEYEPGSHSKVKVRILEVDLAKYGPENAFSAVHIKHLTRQSLEDLKRLFVPNDPGETTFDA